MASTWKRDNQTLFPVKQSCCFSSPNRKTQQQHASRFSYVVTFGFLEGENKTSPCDENTGVLCLRGCCFSEWACVYFVYVQINNATQFTRFVLSLTNPVRIHIWLFRWGINSHVSCFVFAFEFFCVSLDFPFHYLLIWKTKSVIDQDEETTMYYLQFQSHHHME